MAAPISAAVGDAGVNYAGTAAGNYRDQANTQIKGWLSDALGRDPSDAEVGQYGNMINPNTPTNSGFMDQIKGQIYTTQEAKNNAVKKASTVTPTQPAADGSQPAAQAGNAQQAPTSPVSATGGIPPPVQAPQAQPSAVGSQNDARTPGATAAAPTYNPYQVSQFNAPNQSHVNGQQNTLLDAIMAHPETMDANTIAQMKEQQKEQALLLGQQQNAQYAQGAVARGTLNGGRTDAFRGNTNATMGNAVLSGNRAVDLAAVAQNRQDQLNALQASSGIAQDQLGRATSSYGTGLQGQMAQAGENQAGFKSQQDANTAAFARSLALAQNAQNIYGQDLSAEFGRNANNLDVQKFLAQQNQFGQNLGFNYDQLGQNGNLGLLNAIMPKPQ